MFVWVKEVSYSAESRGATVIVDTDGVINCIVVSRVETLRLQRHGRMETTNKLVVAQLDQLHTVTPVNILYLPICQHIQVERGNQLDRNY